MLILLIQYFKNFTHPQRILILSFLSLFLPFYMCAGILVLIFIYLLIKKEIKSLFYMNEKSSFLLLFTLLSILMSIAYQNWLGLGISFGFIVFITLILYYRVHITPHFFEFLMDLLLYMSALASLYGLVEYVSILSKFDLNQMEVIVFNTPQNRINSFFFNANYYAMMIEFFIGIAFYKILSILSEPINLDSLKKLFTIGIISALNLFCLYLSGCRTAWPAIIVGIMIMLLFSHHKKSFFTGFTLGILSGSYFIIHPEKIPRVGNIVKYLGVRAGIWKVAFTNIMKHPLIGEGPLTYFHIYKKYHGHPTQHAHNLYIDPFLCFGIIGVVSLLPYICHTCKRIYYLYKMHLNDRLVGLILATISMTLIHGMLDYTVFFIQTGFVFLILVSSFDIYREEINQGID